MQYMLGLVSLIELILLKFQNILNEEDVRSLLIDGLLNDKWFKKSKHVVKIKMRC